MTRKTSCEITHAIVETEVERLIANKKTLDALILLSYWPDISHKQYYSALAHFESDDNEFVKAAFEELFKEKNKDQFYWDLLLKLLLKVLNRDELNDMKHIRHVAKLFGMRKICCEQLLTYLPVNQTDSILRLEKATLKFLEKYFMAVGSSVTLFGTFQNKINDFLDNERKFLLSKPASQLLASIEPILLVVGLLRPENQTCQEIPMNDSEGNTTLRRAI